MSQYLYFMPDRSPSQPGAPPFPFPFLDSLLPLPFSSSFGLHHSIFLWVGDDGDRYLSSHTVSAELAGIRRIGWSPSLPVLITAPLDPSSRLPAVYYFYPLSAAFYIAYISHDSRLDIAFGHRCAVTAGLTTLVSLPQAGPRAVTPFQASARGRV